MSLNCDITQLPNYSTWLSNASVGSHTIGLTAKPSSGSQYYLESNKTTTAGGTTMTWNVYSISATATNVTASASNATKMDVVNSKTLTFTADGSSYKMPTSITVGSTSIEAGTETTVSGVATFLYTRTSDTDGSVKISNPNSATYNVSFTVVGEAQQSYPVKGQIITIESNQYRVLDISGSNAKLLGMFNASSSQVFDSGSSNVYDGSDLDTYLNTTWYGNQSATFQSAVNDSSITTSTYQYFDEPNTPDTPTYTYQYQYNWNNSDYENAGRTATTSAITRKVYALDLKDIYDYFGKVCITSNELMTLFFNQTTAVSTYIWLRSAYASSSSIVWGVDGDRGRVNYYDFSRSLAARPALTIDLSMISWS